MYWLRVLVSLAYCAYWITFFPSGVDMCLISRWPVDLTDCRWITFTLGTFFLVLIRIKIRNTSLILKGRLVCFRSHFQNWKNKTFCSGLPQWCVNFPDEVWSVAVLGFKWTHHRQNPETNYETNCGQFVNHLRSEFFALRVYELVGSYRLLI